jgi:hypothetical protein
LKQFENEQQKSLIANYSLRDDRNTYQFYVRELVAGLTLTPDEEVDLAHHHVQAPVTSKQDILGLITKATSDRSIRYNLRSSPVLKNNESTATVQFQPPSVEWNDSPSSLPISHPPRPDIPIEPILLPPDTPGSPIVSRSLFTLPELVASSIVPAAPDIIIKMSAEFRRFRECGATTDQFLDDAEVQLAWRTLARVHQMTEEPIQLASFNDSNNKFGSQWLFLCTCGEGAVIGPRNSGSRLCRSCRKKVSRRTQQITKKDDLAKPSSHAPWSVLASPVLKLRLQNVRKALDAAKRTSSQLLARLQDDNHSYINANDEQARTMMQKAADFVVNHNKDDAMEILIKDIIIRKGLSKGKEISESQVSEFAKHCVNEIKNFTLVKEDNKSRVRFSPRMMRLAMSLWMRSKKGYEAFREHSIMIMPSVSLLKSMQKGMRMNEGKCAKIYGWFYDTHVSKCKDVTHGHLMCDEMKLKNDIYWNCSDNSMVGLAASNDGVHKLLVEDEVSALFNVAFNTNGSEEIETNNANGNNGDTKATPVATGKKGQKKALANVGEILEYKPAMYVNLWRLRTTRNVTQSCEFFFNTGSLSGDELLRQFMRVSAHYELIGVQILGLLSDAAGQNARLFHLLRSGKTVGASGYPSIEEVSFPNPVNPTRSVATYHCSTHNLKACRNQLSHSHNNGSKLFKFKQVHFGWSEIEECYQRDSVRRAPSTKLRRASVELDPYSVMCVSYAKAPSARETLLEQCLYISEALECTIDLLRIRPETALEIYREVVPMLRENVTEDTAYHVKSALNTLEYTSVVGAIFNDFFLNSRAQITRDNIDQVETEMKDLLSFFDKWFDEFGPEVAPAIRNKQFVAATTYKNVRTSIAGFFSYCQISFGCENPPDFILASHSNSSSIESVFAMVRNMRRDTPQGFITAASVQSSTEAIALMSKLSRASYDSADVPDEDSPSKNLLGRLDVERGQVLDGYFEKSKERNKSARGVDRLFGKVDMTKLSNGYKVLMNDIEKDVLPKVSSVGFVGMLLDDVDFVETMKAGIFTTNSDWYSSLCGLGGTDEDQFNDSCSLVLSRLVEHICNASKSQRSSLDSSYQYRIYKMMTQRNDSEWTALQSTMPICLRSKDVPICLLIMHLSDVLLQWIRNAMNGRSSRESDGKPGDGKPRDGKSATVPRKLSNQELVQYVQRFFGWAVFSVKKNLESQSADHEEEIELLDSMSVYHHEVIDDEDYMATCYSPADQLSNRGGLCLISKKFIGFGRHLMMQLLTLDGDSSFRCNGNLTISNHVDGALGSTRLKRIFWSCCGRKFPDVITDEEDKTIDWLYDELVEKVAHAWGGQMSDKFKEVSTARHVKTANTVTLRGKLDITAQSKKKEPKGKKKENKENS